MTTPHAVPAHGPAHRPDDRPFDFNLDAVRSEKDLTPFAVHWGGRRFIFRHLEDLDVWPLVEAADTGSDNAAMAAVFEQALGTDQWREFRAIPMPTYKMTALWAAYEKHCGVESGESQGSTGS